ncbi:MAG TPA: polysaccharide biosynthesis protein [Geobacter sp.]|nr:polysaccharide biosynthesis protein [Geobacter sp.]
MKNDHLLSFEVDKRTIGKSAVSSIVFQLLTKLKGLITMPILTMFMAPAELGAFNLITVTSSMLIPIVTLNLTDGVGILFAQEKDVTRIANMFNTVLNVVVLLTACFFLAAAVLGALFTQYDGYLVWIGLLLLGNIAHKLPVFLLATYQKSGIVLGNVFKKDMAVTLFTILLVCYGYSYRGMVIAAFVFQMLFSLLLYRKIFSSIDYSFRIDRRLLKQFLRMSLPLLPVFFFSWIVQSSDSYFLAYFSGKEVVGKYSVIYGISNIILSITFALNFFWFPVSARLWTESREKYTEVFRVIFTGMAALLLTAVCLFELNSATIMELFIRRAAYHDAHVIMGTIAFAFSMQVLITLLTAPLYSNRNTRAILMAYCAGGILNTVLNVLLIPKMGIVGAAVSTAVAYLLIVMVMAVLNYRLAGFFFVDPRLKYVVVLLLACWGLLGWARGHLSTPGILCTDVAFVALVSAAACKKGMHSGERDYLAGLVTNFSMKQTQGA